MQVSYDNATRHLCVIGDPISHSLSPVIYNALFRRYGINALYHTIRVAKGELPRFLPAVRMLNLVGFNATMPHKADLMPLLDELGDSAKLHGCVNTVVVKDGRLCGHSTDARGFLLSLAERGVKIEGQDVLLLGAGGAAGAIALQAAHDGARSLCILNRDAGKAEALCKLVEHKTGLRCAAGALTPESTAAFAQRSTLVVNATPMGMEGVSAGFPSFAFLDALPSSSSVCDLIYKPAQTELLAQAKSRGLTAVGGIGMLLYQAFAAFEHYYGILPGKDEKALVEQAMRDEGYVV